MFKKVLIANRGEIACRVIRSCDALGVGTVAVYSEADAQARHVRQADEAVCIGAPPVAASYLRVEAILDAARATGAEAIHPGYGLLSENSAFASATIAAGLTFIGPRPETIALMGDKLRSRALAAEAGVPILPASCAVTIEDEDGLLAAGRAVGYPLLVKLSAGGGGIGMTRVSVEEKLVKALKKAARRGESAFGDPTAYLERAVERARHIEVQILADGQGTVLHLLERDCSLQRRHQKVVEEAPAPGMTAELRAAMTGAAVRLATAVDYRSAGTVEFLLDPSGDFYFLEMNTRIQVEHPVTEMITGVDLVAWQIRIAAGQALDLKQEDIRAEGHAIELRLYAEDPIRFLPQPGTVERWVEPSGEGIRVDHAIDEGMEVTPYYDPMLAKLIAHGSSRQEALARAREIMSKLVLEGITHNGPLHSAILADPEFLAGDVHTGLLADLAERIVSS
jgi:acetyl-CoA carboxylase biotin carboxylase subunit